MNTDDRFVRSDDIVARDVGGEAVLLHLDKGTYYGLNAVGSRVWQLLADGPRPFGEIAAQLQAEFDAPAKTIETDLRELLQDLLANDLISAVD